MKTVYYFQSDTKVRAYTAEQIEVILRPFFGARLELRILYKFRNLYILLITYFGLADVIFGGVISSD
jgi:hypothetical protein